VNANVLQGGFSFVGVAFTTEQVARVRIINGSTALGPNDSPNDGGIDVVALDDFIYAEPGYRSRHRALARLRGDGRG
jgi:hypothetical protein